MSDTPKDWTINNSSVSSAYLSNVSPISMFFMIFFMMWRGCVCLVYFSFSLNTDSKSSLLMYHVNWQSAPTFSWFLFLRCHLLQNHRNKLEGECLNHFFSLFTFALLSSSLKRSPSQSCYYVNQLRIVSHFCLPGDRCWASWKCKCKYISYSVSKAHFHHILLTF